MLSSTCEDETVDDAAHSPGQDLSEIEGDGDKSSAVPTEDDAAAVTSEEASMERADDDHQARDQDLRAEHKISHGLRRSRTFADLTSLFRVDLSCNAEKQDESSPDANAGIQTSDDHQSPGRDETPKEETAAVEDAASMRPSTPAPDAKDKSANDEPLFSVPHGLNLGPCWMMAYPKSPGYYDYFTELTVPSRPMNWKGYGPSRLCKVENASSISTDNSDTDLSYLEDTFSSFVSFIESDSDDADSAGPQCSEPSHPLSTMADNQDSDALPCGHENKSPMLADLANKYDTPDP